MKHLEKVYGYSYGSSLEVKIFRTASIVRVYEVEVNGKALYYTDNEPKARMIAETFVDGYKAAKALQPVEY